MKKKDKGIIVIGGKMYSGKTSLASVIQSSGIRKWAITPIAQDIKTLVDRYHGFNGNESTRQKEILRPEYQKLGSLIRNHMSDDFWVKVCLNRPEPFKLIDDCRLPSEIMNIRQSGIRVITIWLDASDDMRRKRCHFKHGVGSFQHTSHETETSFSGEEAFWDIRVKNEGESIVDFMDQMRPLTDKINDYFS